MDHNSGEKHNKSSGYSALLIKSAVILLCHLLCNHKVVFRGLTLISCFLWHRDTRGYSLIQI